MFSHLKARKKGLFSHQPTLPPSLGGLEPASFQKTGPGSSSICRKPLLQEIHPHVPSFSSFEPSHFPRTPSFLKYEKPRAFPRLHITREKQKPFWLTSLIDFYPSTGPWGQLQCCRRRPWAPRLLQRDRPGSQGTMTGKGKGMTNKCHLRINVHKIVKKGEKRGRQAVGEHHRRPNSWVRPTHSIATAKEGHQLSRLLFRGLR